MTRQEPDFYADYRCMKCQYKWRHLVGPVECPSCGHLYVKWLDFDRKWEQRGAGWLPKPEYRDEALRP